MTEDYSLVLDPFELGLLYGLVTKEIMYANDDMTLMYTTILQKIVKIRRSMDGGKGLKA